MKRANLTVCALIALLRYCSPAAGAAGSVASETEVWNDAISSFDAGDVTNALRLLRPLMVSKVYSARAAEVVAKIEFDKGNLEEAAAAAQIALRANALDERANRNFTRAVSGLAEYREKKRIDSVLKDSKGKDPGAMLGAAVRDVRRLMADSGVYRTNCAERVVALSDSLSASAEKLSDILIPVREAVAAGTTNREEAVAVIARLDQTRSKTLKAAKELVDLDPEAYATLSEAERDFTGFLKMTIMPLAAVNEALTSQSNAWLDVEVFNGRDWQRDSLDYTRAFRSRFPAWAREYERQAQSDTNKPPFSAETQARVSALAVELEKVQLECCEKNLPPEQERAIGMLIQIRDLLPKDGGGGSSQESGESGSGNDGQNGRPQQEPESENSDGKSDERQSEDPEAKEEARKDGDLEDGKEQSDPKVDSVLRRAQERNDEYEADKKARMRKAPLPPNERDW